MLLRLKKEEPIGRLFHCPFYVRNEQFASQFPRTLFLCLFVLFFCFCLFVITSKKSLDLKGIVVTVLSFFGHNWLKKIDSKSTSFLGIKKTISNEIF